MDKEEKDVLTAGYWVKVATMVQEMDKHCNSAKDFKELLLKIVDVLNKIIKLEDKNYDE